MTRKDYVLIATALDAARCASNDDDVQEGVTLAARYLCIDLAATYPRFDRDRFLKACGETRRAKTYKLLAKALVAELAADHRRP